VTARRFFEKSIAQNGVPETVTIDKSGSNLAALHAVNAERETPITTRQVKYLNKVVEQDRRAIKRITRPMPCFKDFRCARIISSGIEVMHMIRKGQMKTENGTPLSTPFERSSSVRFEACSSKPASGGLLPSSVQHHKLSLVFVTHSHPSASSCLPAACTYGMVRLEYCLSRLNATKPVDSTVADCVTVGLGICSSPVDNH
jgi:hypothetical protein